MGSGNSSLKCGSYEGAGAAGLKVELGFQPRSLKIWSVEGSAHWAPAFPGAAVKIAAAAPAFVDEVRVAEDALGFSLEGTNDALNKSGVKYYYEAM